MEELLNHNNGADYLRVEAMRKDQIDLRAWNFMRKPITHEEVVAMRKEAKKRNDYWCWVESFTGGKKIIPEDYIFMDRTITYEVDPEWAMKMLLHWGFLNADSRGSCWWT